MNFIARETRKLAIKSNRITHISPKHTEGVANESASTLHRQKTL